MIKAIRKTRTTAICPDCGKQHRIHKVSQGEYIKGCIYPCCVYWVKDTQADDNHLLLDALEMKAEISRYILVPDPIVTERDIDIALIGSRAQWEVDKNFYESLLSK